MTDPESMKVTYRVGGNNCCSNILWSGRYPMRGGKFPASHPVGNGEGPGCQFGAGSPIETFRSRGYWASCFPEGDGITFIDESDPKRAPEVVAKDITECFGWEVRILR